MKKKYYSKYKNKKPQKIKTPVGSIDRLKIIFGVFIIATAVIVLRLFQLQIIEHGFYETLAEGQHELYEKLVPDRGEIYVQDPYAEDGLYAIASNQPRYLVYAEPKRIEDPEDAAERLSPLLNIEKDELIKKFSDPEDPYEPLKKRMSEMEVEAIQELDVKGIGYQEELWRYYPEAECTSHLTGFLGLVEDMQKGQYGLEGYFEDTLSGEPGYLQTEKDAGGRFLAIGDHMIEEAKDGDNLILTIDKNIQFAVCERLKESVEGHGAKEGSVIVIEPKTGAIKAHCNYPFYDPNKYSDVESIDVFMDSTVADQYEPGSVFKVITMAAGLDMGKVTPSSTYEDTGAVQIGNYTIRNSDGKSHGVVDMNTVLSESLNTGSIHVARLVGDEAFYQYVDKFGFGQTTGIPLAGENAGNIAGLGKLKDIYTATASYGQGITVTPIQLAMAFSAIANDGVLMKPYLVQEVHKGNGYVEKYQPEEVRQVMSSAAANTLSAMMVKVIDGGHATLAAVDGYFMAGKTGTAQIPKENGVGYDANRHKDTFVGFGPVSDPQFVVFVKIDEPKDVMWSAASTAPLFGDIAEYLVNYLQIPPDR
ncbi:penicillin-binding protein 2 [Patescibacteria group bacterium]|nr:penicillin-binding protein 2 [Patescibacteria group bacterium]MBU1672914.1 penicillin-binding protein 2 [Patescibacteria group bacterium]MBU1963385.1 penicillin-binding protein 2 [Patescibacteria group bacterium]